jgi:hypothetical protein
MQAFLDYVVKGLVDRPDAVRIDPVEKSGATCYEMHVHPSDVGKIIGRKGNTIHALRSLVQVGGAKLGKRVSVELREDRVEE